MKEIIHDFKADYIDRKGRRKVFIIPYDENNIDRLKRELKFDLDYHPFKYKAGVTLNNGTIDVPISHIDIESIEYLGIYGKYKKEEDNV